MMGNGPLLVGFVADLMLTTRIETAAARLGYQVEWIGRPADIVTPEEQAGVPGLLEMLSALHPALVLFDLGNTAIPWREWIGLLKSSPATRRLPVVCFGSHVDVDSLQAARRLGADGVLARSGFLNHVPAIIEKYARQPDYSSLQAGCQEGLPDLAIEGLQAFNQGAYFEAHELLEEAWNQDSGATRELYRAILQVAVAYLQIERGNYNGAVKMFLRLRQWIDPLPGSCRGVDVEQLRQDAGSVRAALVRLGAEGITRFDRALFKPVHFTSPFSPEPPR